MSPRWLGLALVLGTGCGASVRPDDGALPQGGRGPDDEEPVDCGTRASEGPIATVPVSIENARTTPIYLGSGRAGTVFASGRPVEPEPPPDDTGVPSSCPPLSCDFLIGSANAGCPLIFVPAPIARIEPGERIVVREAWAQADADRMVLPAECRSDGSWGDTACLRSRPAPEGEYIVGASAWSDASCTSDASCRCDAARDDGCWLDAMPLGELLDAESVAAIPTEGEVTLVFE